MTSWRRQICRQVGERMKNKEQIQRDLAIAFDFVEQLVETPKMLDNIPDGSSIAFLDEENVKREKPTKKDVVKKYAKIKRHFEVL